MAQTKPKAGQFYGVSNNGTDGEFLQTDGVGGMAWASTIVDPTITSIDYPGTQTATDPAGGESVIINGTLFASGITCTVGGTAATTAFNSATQITITTPAKVAGAYTVAVANTDGGTASQANFIQYSGVPIWTTASGNIGSVMEGAAASLQVTATEGSDTIEYAVTVGTLPSGLSLATATGAITGTAPAVSADTTTTFSITATDDENQTSAVRSFNIIITNDAPSNHFNTVIYTGNGNPVAYNVGFEPGLVWFKERNGINNYQLYDTVRGDDYALYSNTTDAQYNYSTHPNGDLAPSLTSTGFTTSPVVNNGINRSGGTYVAWSFKAGGTAVSNTDGTITSQVSANTTTGFSVVKYTGNQTAGASIGHGLDSAPSMVIMKNMVRSGYGWLVYHEAVSPAAALVLNTNATKSTGVGYFNNAATTSTTFTLGNDTFGNYNGDSYIAYCFSDKPGFSKVGSYTGARPNDVLVQTDFEPAFVLIKASNAVDNWFMFDNKREGTSAPTKSLNADLSSAESSFTGIDFLTNGFKLVGSANSGGTNNSGTTFIYLAFAADGSTATPALANSFATEAFTGNGYPGSGNQSITTGFAPDFSWIKNRNVANTIVLFDSIRGPGRQLASSNTSGQAGFNGTTLTSFDSNGFSVGTEQGVNGGGNGIVAWNWKAGGTASINTDGTVTSLVSANQAAGFSVIKWNNNNTVGTVGHGLSGAPDMYFIKNLVNSSNSWIVSGSSTIFSNPLTDFLRLNVSDAVASTNSGDVGVNGTSTLNVGIRNIATGSSVIYCWKSIAGYSKIGSFSGSGSSGNFQNIGFTPTWIMIKATNNASDWYIIDNKRPGGNTTREFLGANLNGGTYNASESNAMQFVTNGFQFGGSSFNTSGYDYIYLAIKEN